MGQGPRVEFRNGLSSLHNAQEIAAGAKVLDRRQAGSQRTFRPASDRRSTMATWVRTRAGERSPRRPRQRRVRPWRGSAPEGLRSVPRGAPATRLAPRPLVGWPPPVLGWPGLAGVANRHRACRRCRCTGPAPRNQTRAGCRHQILDERARVTAAEGPVCRPGRRPGRVSPVFGGGRVVLDGIAAGGGGEGGPGGCGTCHQPGHVVA